MPWQALLEQKLVLEAPPGSLIVWQSAQVLSKLKAVLRQPGCGEVRLRLVARRQGVDRRYRLAGQRDLRDGVADVALQPDGLVVLAEVLAVMAAEAAREVLVPDVVAMCDCQVDVHEGEGCPVEDRLQFGNGLLHIGLAAVVHVREGVLVEIGYCRDGWAASASVS